MASVSGSWTRQVEVDGIPGSELDVGSLEVFLNVPLWLVPETTVLVPGACYELVATAISGVPGRFLSVRDFHPVSVPILLRHRFNEKWTMVLRVAPGFAGDFRNFGDDHFRFAALAMGSYAFSPRLQLGLGLRLDFLFGSPNPHS